MSQIDEELKGVKHGGTVSVATFNQLMSKDIGQVTSRDQIIDPYALVNPANYRKNRVGQAQYNSDLQQAQQYAERQEAAYQEWYNSPAQQVARDRAAGLNPDLVGLSGTEAGDTQVNPNSPIAGMPTNGQVAMEAINTAMSVIQTALSAASLAAGIPNIGKQGHLLDAQLDSTNLANVTAFEQLAHKGIASKLATAHAAATAAGSAFDVAAWFADDNNFSDIIPSYAPSDNPMYQHALQRVRKGSESVLADAYSTNSATQQNQQSFAKLLANPYANPNTVIMSAFLEPLMSAVFEMEKVESEYRSSAAEFKKDAMSSIDASEAGDVWLDNQKQERDLTKYQAIMDSCRSAVYQNLKETYLHEPNTPAGHTASMLLLGHYESTIQGLLVSYLSRLLSMENAESLISFISENAIMDTDGDPVSNEGLLGFHAGRAHK